MNLSNETVIHEQKNGIQFLQFKRLLAYQDVIRHAYSLGLELNFRTSKPNKEPISQKELDLAMQSYQGLCESIGSNYHHVIKTNQEHTDYVTIVSKKVNADKPDINLSQYHNTDGLITKTPNLLLSTTNADCILLLFFDPVQKVIANVHSGWKGTLQRISTKTVEKMCQEFGCHVQDIICCICPSIRKCHFEVEQEVKDKFEKEFSDISQNTVLIEEKIPHTKWNIDTVLINQIILEKIGLKKDNIIDSGICSVCHSDLIHSYRVEKQGYGLGTALIELI